MTGQDTTLGKQGEVSWHVTINTQTYSHRRRTEFSYYSTNSMHEYCKQK